MLYPLSAYITWPVIQSDMLLNKNVATFPTCVVVTFWCNGAFSSTTVNIDEKSLIPFADNVFIGPAETAFTLIFSFPKFSAKSNTCF